MRIADRTFVISGGCSGLGLATVQLLLEEGAYVSVLDIGEPSTEWRRPANVKFFKVDISELEEIEAAVESTVQWTNATGAQLGGVVNCAAIAGAAKMVEPLHSLDLWNKLLDINITGTFNLTRLVLKHLIKVKPEGDDGERGVVIMVSSAAAFEGQVGQVGYAATKGAIRSMTLPLSSELARYGVRVNSIAPGAFTSAMTDMMSSKVRKSMEVSYVYPRRFGRADEFAKTIKWILETPFVNGETLRLSGGVRMPTKL